jgi:Icc-related predicted phosphoesterase
VRPVAKRTRLYFATDLHGSEKCFRKFLNAGPVYGADVVVLGGDVAGKAIQSLVRSDGRYHCTFRGVDYDVEEGDELSGLEQLIADHGYYPYRAEPGELEARDAEGTLDDLFLELMHARLARWLALADERLRPKGLPVYWMLGNDDPTSLEAVLDAAPWGVHADERIEVLPSGHELYSFGHSNLTPWQSYRELPEERIQAALDDASSRLQRPECAIFNVHVPPYDTGLDEAPILDSALQVQQSAGQVKMAPVGSTAVREVIERVQPMLGLHGHIHEASGFRRLGRTLCINPGSDYGIGVLNGVLVTLEPDKVKAHQFVRG